MSLMAKGVSLREQLFGRYLPQDVASDGVVHGESGNAITYFFGNERRWATRNKEGVGGGNFCTHSCAGVNALGRRGIFY